MMRYKKTITAVLVLSICALGGLVSHIQFVSRVEFASVEHTIFSEAQASAPVSVPSPKAAPTSSSIDARPRTISIPAINLMRGVIDIGVTDAGNLDVPPNYTQVGWYKYGTLPGQVGSAVLDGHVDNGASIPGPFKRLREVKIGDEIIVTAADGTRQKFTVTDSKVYPTNQFPGELVFHDKSGPLLKIITCHGTFVPSLYTYDQRLIVTAMLVT